MTAKSPAKGSGPAGFKRRGRIVFYLLAVLVVVGLAPLAIVSWKLIDINRLALTTAQQEFQLLLASSTANELHTHVEGLRSELTGVAQTLGAAIDREGAVRKSEIGGVLRDVAGSPLDYIRYSYSNSQGGQSISAGELPEEFSAGFTKRLEDAVIRWATVREQGDASAVLTDPLFAADGPGRAMLVVAAPVVTHGRFRGVLAGLVDLQTVWQSVMSHTRTGHELYALDGSGRVFATSDPDRIPPGHDVRASPLVGRFLSGEGRSRETMPFELDTNGEPRRYMGSYAATGQNWGVFVRAPEQEVYLPVQAMIESALTWSLGALAVAVIVAVFFANTLSGPIKGLARATATFASGDFTSRVRTRSRTELGELAFAFNKMADDIEGQIHRLRRAAEENNELFLGTIRAMAQAIDAKDRYTRGHSVRVNRYAVIIAEELGLSGRELRDIYVASLLHDVGKIGVDDAVLNKPGKLTDEEFELMKKHTIFGANILAPIRQMKRILPGLRWHHERWAGGGYPDGLDGENIPLMARIIAVADTFDAITTTRPYQKTMTVQEALETVNRLKGVNLDDRIVDAFFRAFRAGKIRVQKPTPATAQAAETPAHANPEPEAVSAT